MTSNQTIIVTETINASKAKIFELLTDEKQLTTWFPSRAEANAVVGGEYRFSFEFLDPDKTNQKKSGASGKYLTVDPNGRLTFTWSIEDTEVDIVLQENEGKTEVSLTHSGWKSEKEYLTHESGWIFFLQNLKSVLENGTDTRFSTMGMLSPAQLETV